MLVSILLNTIDRYELTVKCIGSALATAGFPFELLVCDNGSTDARVAEYTRSLHPTYFRVNGMNAGIAHMHNQMLLRARGDWFCLLDNDIEIRWNGWLAAMVNAYERVPLSGIQALYTAGLSPELHPEVEVCGVKIHPAVPPKEDAAFGTRLFGRKVLEKVGYFCEEYDPYSLADNEYNWRAYHAGFVNYYLGGPECYHLDLDVGQNTGYRRMKDESMRVAFPKFQANMERYKTTENYYLPPPNEY